MKKFLFQLLCIDEELTSELLDRVRITRSELHNVAQVLNNVDRLQEITAISSGATIHEALEGEGTVTARVFLDWWLSEDIFQGLHRFMETEFDGRAQLLERSGVHSCRYRIQKPQVVSKSGKTGVNKGLKGAAESKFAKDNDDDDEGNVLKRKRLLSMYKSIVWLKLR